MKVAQHVVEVVLELLILLVTATGRGIVAFYRAPHDWIAAELRKIDCQGYEECGANWDRMEGMRHLQRQKGALKTCELIIGYTQYIGTMLLLVWIINALGCKMDSGQY